MRRPVPLGPPGLRQLAGHSRDVVRRELAGAATRRLARRYFTEAEFQQARVNGRTLEIADAAWAVEHAVSARVRQGSALELPWPDRSFDAVISQDFMEHVHPDDLPAVLAEQVRVARPGAALLHLIPFYPFDPPIQVDAHLCQATQDWWAGLFEGVEGLEIARRPEEGVAGRLAGYFALRRTTS